MRLVIIVSVVALHLALLAWIVGACRSTEKSKEPDQRQTTARQARENHSATAPPGKNAAGKTERDGIPPWSPAFFSDASRPLPATLEAKTRACRAGVLVDWTGRRRLWAKQADRAFPIASLTKMMTVLLLMQDVKQRDDLSLATMVQVTRAAARVGGRQVWLDPREKFSLEDLLRCILIRSANDCAYLVGEFLAGGDYAAFVARMNRTAGKLGLDTLKFYNSHGLPTGGHENLGSPEQLAYLAGRLLAYDQVVKWSSTRLSYIREDTKPFQLVSTNKLLGACPGVNGMKTGYTSKAGYCLAATCERNGRQVIAVALGCPSGKSRDALVRALIEWAYTTI